MRKSGLFLMVWLALPNLLWGASYYLDPENGNMGNPGTLAKPWRALEEVLAGPRRFTAGDTLYLRSGYHGVPVVSGECEPVITIKACPDETPAVSRIKIGKARGWRIEGLSISPDPVKPYRKQLLVDLSEEASEIVIENCSLFSVQDSSNWSAEDWVNKACNGFDVSGTRNRIINNRLLNVRFGISVDGPDNLVEFNTVENFSGDGLRALGDGGIFRYNIVKNCYDVDDNHDDGIQSWSTGPGGVGTGVVKNVVIEGNLIINYTDPEQKYRGTLQGIGCFDGFFENWLIANNVIVIDHWHGITLAGARNCRILNNTVVDNNETTPGPPWITIGNHKNGKASSGNLVRNNLAKKFTSKPEVGQLDHNLVITDYETFFVDYPKFDLRLKTGCPARDAGSNEGVSVRDFLRRDRRVGAAVDAGAIEFVPETE